MLALHSYSTEQKLFFTPFFELRFHAPKLVRFVHISGVIGR